MQYARSFIRLNWIALVLIFMVVVAGSFVRITGSGMGCPDWPKCFGQWVPPTQKQELPENYKEIYSQKRAEKIEKFTKFLRAMGMGATADKLAKDPTLLVEQNFNARKTWTEYGNRLVGFLAGNALLVAFLWILLKYRKRKLVIIAGVNLILMGIEAWFGSIVVASNLTPWTITIHMFLALLIIGLQLYIIRLISPSQQTNLHVGKWLRIAIWICFIITVYQMFLGTQVRESIDELTKQGIGRSAWTDELGLPFYIHRSFSWLVLILMAFIAWKNEQTNKLLTIRWVFSVLVLELITGVLLAYADMPGLVQTSHLVFASIIFGILTMLIFRIKSDKAVIA